MGKPRQVLASGAGDIIVKRMTIPLAAQPSGGVIPIQTLSSNPTTATEWSSFAARYQQFRVRRIILVYKALTKYNAAASANLHDTIAVGEFLGTSVPTTYAQIVSDEKGQVFGTNQDIRFEADWSRNPNAKLWAPTSATLPSQNRFAIVYGSGGNVVLNNGVVYYAGVQYIDVELRGAQ